MRQIRRHCSAQILIPSSSSSTGLCRPPSVEVVRIGFLVMRRDDVEKTIHVDPHFNSKGTRFCQHSRLGKASRAVI
jgi:hypothetical protein